MATTTVDSAPLLPRELTVAASYFTDFSQIFWGQRLCNSPACSELAPNLYLELSALISDVTPDQRLANQYAFSVFRRDFTSVNPWFGAVIADEHPVIADGLVGLTHALGVSTYSLATIVWSLSSSPRVHCLQDLVQQLLSQVLAAARTHVLN